MRVRVNFLRANYSLCLVTCLWSAIVYMEIRQPVSKNAKFEFVVQCLLPVIPYAYERMPPAMAAELSSPIRGPGCRASQIATPAEHRCAGCDNPSNGIYAPIWSELPRGGRPVEGYIGTPVAVYDAHGTVAAHRTGLPHPVKCRAPPSAKHTPHVVHMCLTGVNT